MSPNDEVLIPSPNFSMEYDFKGRPYLSALTFPYDQVVNLDEEYRILLNCFAGKGTRVKEALKVFNKIQGAKKNPKRGSALVESLKSVGALVAKNEVPSMYVASMAEYYAEHRTIPPRVVDWVIRAGRIGKKTRVLDLACGTGALTNQLAKVSRDVTGIDVSKSFLDKARKDAHKANLRVRYIQESCNRLSLHKELYDIVVISCAYHWLDQFQWAKGVLQVLRKNGRVIILHGDLFLPKAHPLHFLKNYRSDKPPISYLNHLFKAVWRKDKLRFVPEFKFVEKREIGTEYMRGYSSPEHLRTLKLRGWKDVSDFWSRMARKTSSSSHRDLKGFFYWHGLKLEHNKKG